MPERRRTSIQGGVSRGGPRTGKGGGERGERGDEDGEGGGRGSEPVGNITAGTSLSGRADGGKASGVVFPLVTNSQGTKFGKSQGGNVWLDPQRTRPYRFYQFCVNTDDAAVVRTLKMFTLLPREERAAL